ncbi:MAG: hypothetical protein JWO62_1659 [Acidimicrobiaceae bacterium]|nr:hypothetical protein [Acidimicrobiaceae bacterium]
MTESVPTKAQRGSHPQWVAIADMKVNPAAQREFRQSRAEELASDFDLDAIGTIVLNRRDERWYIVDGQHRVEALKLIGYGDQSILCDCFEGLTEQQEADKFLKLNDRLNVPAPERFKVGVTAGRKIPVDVRRVVMGCGLRISSNGDTNSIGATAALESVYSVGGAAVLARTIAILRDAYGGASAAFSAENLRGIGLLCRRFNGQLDDAVLIDRLAKMPGGAVGLRGKVATTARAIGRPKAHCVAAVCVEAVNAGRGGKKLPDWWS